MDVFEVADELTLAGKPRSLDVFDVADAMKYASKGPEVADPGFAARAKMGFAVEPQSDMSILAKSLFPDEPNALGRFGRQNGQIIYLDKDGTVKQAEQGGAAGFLGESGPSMAGGIVGSLLGGTPVTSVLAGGAGAAGGELIRRQLSRLFFNEHQKPLDDLGAAGLTGVTDIAFGAGFLKLAKLARGAKGLKVFDDYKPDEIQSVIDDIYKKTGIQVDAAQASGSRSLQQLRDWAARQPSRAADQIQALGEMQGKQSQAAVQKLLDNIALDVPEEAGGKRVIGAANAAILNAKTIVQDSTRPLYDAAIRGADEAGVKVNTSKPLQMLESLIAQRKGPARRALESARDMFKAADGEAWDQSMSGLQSTKLALDAMIEGKGADLAIDRVTKRDLVQLKQLLVESMEEASPLYSKANKMYGAETERLVTPLTDGVVGTLADLESQGLHTAARSAAKLITNPNIPMSEVWRARNAITQTKGGKAAWAQVGRLWLSGALERAAKETQTGEVVNFAGKFRQAVFATPKQRELAKVVLGENFSTFDDVMRAFDMVAKYPIRGSNTAADQLITRNMGSGVAGAVRTVRNVGSNVLDAMDDRSAMKQAGAIADAMTDPSKLRKLKILRELPPGQTRAALIVGLITGEGARNLASGDVTADAPIMRTNP